jgi:hypothetical protein
MQIELSESGPNLNADWLERISLRIVRADELFAELQRSLRPGPST